MRLLDNHDAQKLATIIDNLPSSTPPSLSPLLFVLTSPSPFPFVPGRYMLRQNAKDIIALGYNRESTFMFSDLECDNSTRLAFARWLPQCAVSLSLFIP